MVTLRRITEATDSSHTSIMYNLADNLSKKGWNCKYTDNGLRVDFSFDEDFDPKKTKEGKAWLKNNPDKDFQFKGKGLNGTFYWDVKKSDSGKRELVTKDLSVKGDKNLLSLQKKLKADKPESGKLTGRSVKPFVYPEPYIITNLVSPTFQSFLNKYKDKIILDAALALCEVIDLPTKKESNQYFIEYDEDFTRINEGYVTESKEDKTISWKDADVQKAITDAIKGLEINKSKTTDKELIFKHGGKNGSLHLQGYMLVLDTDTDDEIPPTNYPVKDKNNLTLDNLLATIKTVFSRRESLKEPKTEDHKWDDDIQSDELTNPVPEPTYYILSGDPEDPSVGMNEPQWNLIEGDEDGYLSKEEAIAKAKEIAKRKNLRYTVYGVTKNPVEIQYFVDDSFWDAVDDGVIEVEEIHTSLHESEKVEESVEDHLSYHEDVDLDIISDSVNKKLVEKLEDSFTVSPEFKGICDNRYCDNKNIVWLSLSPSYAINPVSDIVVPVILDNHKVSLPCVSIPEPEAVFGDKGYTENAIADYIKAVQSYLVNDAPMSDIAEINMDNYEDVRGQVVDLVNTMAEDYQNKKSTLLDSLDLKGESLLKESRYYIVPSDTDLSSSEEVVKLTPLGFTDLTIAKKEMKDLLESGRFDYDLKILDTNFSNNKDKWILL